MWTPEQALLAALKMHEKYDCIVVAGIMTENGVQRSDTLTARADNRDLYFLAEALKNRARRAGG